MMVERRGEGNERNRGGDRNRRAKKREQFRVKFEYKEWGRIQFFQV